VTCRLPALLAVTLALGACNAQTPTAPSRYTNLDATLDSRLDPRSGVGSGPSTASARKATTVALLPAWIGRPTSLRERDDADAFEQAITLGGAPRGTAGDNVVLVGMRRLGGGPGRQGDDGLGRLDKPTQEGIRAEMAAAFPGLAMQVVTRPAANAYGPYGLAIGRDPGGARCLYAWQWIAEPPALGPAEAVAPVSLRVRLCRADMTLEAMAAAVNQLRIVPRFAGTPLAEARVAAGRPLAGPRRGTQRPSRAARRPEPEVRRDLAPSALAAATPPDSSGRRYLGTEAPPAAAGIMPGALAGLGAGVAAPTAGVTTADLPPEATRGPAGPSAR